jgi:sulfur carrier protein ThiS
MIPDCSREERGVGVISVEVYLYAYLRRYRPEAELGSPVLVTVEEQTAVGQLLDSLGIPREVRHVVFVNGIIQREEYFLHTGDRIAVFPPLAGGGPAKGGARDG